MRSRISGLFVLAWPSRFEGSTVADTDEYGMAHGYSAIAHKTVCVDFDGTIIPWGPLMADARVFPGVGDAMRRLKAAGYTIAIFSSRFSEHYLKSGQDKTIHE